MKQIGATFTHNEIAALIKEEGRDDKPPRTNKPLRLTRYLIRALGDGDMFVVFKI